MQKKSSLSALCLIWWIILFGTSFSERDINELGFNFEKQHWNCSSVIKLCDDCPPGTFSNKDKFPCSCCSEQGKCPNNYMCSACPTGSYQPSSSSEKCMLCPEGKFQNTSGQTSCLQCPEGTFCKNLGCETCQLCPLGHFSSVKGSKDCVPCPIDFHQPGEGKSKCLQCVPGYEASEIGQSNCIKCKIGHFKNSTMSKCEPCPPGHEASNDGQDHCSPCPAGFFKPDSGEGKCLPCENGAYVIIDGAKVCNTCHSGYYCPCASCDPIICPEQAVCPDGSVFPISCKSPFFERHGYICYFSDTFKGLVIGFTIIAVLLCIVAVKRYLKRTLLWHRVNENSCLIQRPYSEPVYTGL